MFYEVEEGAKRRVSFGEKVDAIRDGVDGFLAEIAVHVPFFSTLFYLE
ncbi:MAG: hypothetical protein LBD64_03850 [Odoribacteraceae bacterium]|jgi:hypothetical protein|nr:hypothetical protein [Odoribacteraceae bacterium]